MSPECDCGAWVSPDYYRVRCDNDGDLHGCPECTSPAVRARAAAGASVDYLVRTDADGRTIPRDRVATDGGEEA